MKTEGNGFLQELTIMDKGNSAPFWKTSIKHTTPSHLSFVSHEMLERAALSTTPCSPRHVKLKYTHSGLYWSVGKKVYSRTDPSSVFSRPSAGSSG